MNFTKRNKKGSALLTTVAMMAILSILIMSILAMTVGGYKLRKETNGRMESFYGADSGLEISERVLINYTEAAVDYSNNEVDKLTGKPTMKEKNEKFKAAFVDFFWKGGESKIQPFYKEGIAIVNDHQYKKTIEEIKEQEYYDILDRRDVEIKTDNNSLVLKDKDGKRVEYSETNGNKTVNYLTLNLKSEYIKDNKDREVAVDFDIKVPDYGKQTVKYSGAEAPSILDYIFGVGGDLKISLNSVTQVYGDLWVRGNTNNNINITNKYNGGISIKGIDDSSKPEFLVHGGIATGGTLDIEDSKVVIQESENESIYMHNIYANNIKMENIKNENSITTPRDIYVYNDLVLNESKFGNPEGNIMTMRNYYGINDINWAKHNGWEEGYIGNEYKNSAGETQNPENAEIKLPIADRSSSIIINAKDIKNTSSKINIKESAYILGTAYVDIKDGKGYQLGQSNSINSFVKPYTQRVDKDGNELNYIYDYMGNLHLANKKIDGETPIPLYEKSEILENYVLQGDEVNMVKILELKKNQLYSTGAMLATVNGVSGIKAPNYEGQSSKIRELQDIYSKEVFNMGAILEDNNSKELSDEKKRDIFWNKDYRNNDVENSFNWEKFPDVIKNLDKEKIENIVIEEDGNIAAFDIKMNIGDVMYNAYHESKKPNLIAYGNGHECPAEIPGFDFVCKRETAGSMTNYDDQTVRIILSSIGIQGTENKDIIITQSKSNVNKFDTTQDGKIIYNIDETEANRKPTLVIARGNVEISNLEFKNLIQVITAESLEIIPPKNRQSMTIGNYDKPSKEIKNSEDITIYQSDQFNFLNELFKYILKDSELMGQIGDDIFSGNATYKDVVESIEVSNIIKKKNWKLIK